MRYLLGYVLGVSMWLTIASVLKAADSNRGYGAVNAVGNVPTGQSPVSFPEFMAKFDAAVKHAPAPVILEGLPHRLERELLEAEKKRAATVQLHGEIFYATAQPVAREDAEKLRVALAAATRPSRGVKLCGGFHADYAIRWVNAEGNYDALVCFTCSEMKLYINGRELMTDFSSKEFESARTLLASFQKERPPRDFVKVK